MEINIKNYPLSLRIGHFKPERGFVRTVFISLVLRIEKGEGPFCGDLGRTIDYGEVLSFLDDEFKDTTYRLIESVLYEIARGLLKRFSLLEGLDISVEKTFIEKSLVKGAKISIKENFKRVDFI